MNLPSIKYHHKTGLIQTISNRLIVGLKNSKIKKYLFKNNSEFISLINILLKSFDKKSMNIKQSTKLQLFHFSSKTTKRPDPK